MKMSKRQRWIMLAISAFSTTVPEMVVASLPADGRRVIVSEGITQMLLLQQNWTDQEANEYYNKSQGSQALPYTWFLHLEQADSTDLFRDNANMLKLGYLPRKADANGNPDGLPIGFVQNGNQLGLNCASCHTSQINFKGTALLIDGGPTMADTARMFRELEAALRATQADAGKFSRFAKAVLGPVESDETRAELRKDLASVLELRAEYDSRNFPPGIGPGRIDAFGAILNEVAVRFARSPGGVAPADAPVSVPFLWDTPRHDFVQWNGSAENKDVPLLEPIIGTRHLGALGRNVGEVLGVFGDVNTSQQEFPRRGYASSVNIPNLVEIEETVRRLWSPEWPADQFGQPDAGQVELGKKLYDQNCVSCHKILTRNDPNRTVKAMMSDVGTDQTMARNVATRTSSSGILEGRLLLTPPVRKLRATEPVAALLEHVSQHVIFGTRLLEPGTEMPLEYVFRAEIGQGPNKLTVGLANLKMKADKLISADITSLLRGKNGQAGAGTAAAREGEKPNVTVSLNAAPEAAGDLKVESNSGAAEPVKLFYKARPLNGIWATAPYLHNGSVLNLDELLKPAAERLEKFKVGTREFDPVNVGFINEGPFEFDTKAQPGNSNAGHEYGKTKFTKEERAQLIAFMKTL